MYFSRLYINIDIFLYIEHTTEMSDGTISKRKSQGKRVLETLSSMELFPNWKHSNIQNQMNELK